MRCVSLWSLVEVLRRLLPSRQQLPRPVEHSVATSRLTLRFSGREKHKVHAAGVQRQCAHGRHRARVLEGQWPAAELGS
jgi:hypothetical protein